ncbi:hypothetical protein GCM10027427_26030 [Pseudoclavibacter terrae]
MSVSVARKHTKSACSFRDEPASPACLHPDERRNTTPFRELGLRGLEIARSAPAANEVAGSGTRAAQEPLELIRAVAKTR